MYTLHDLQEKLDKAKSTLREVESNISRVEGKPSNINFARFSKNDFRGREDSDGTPTDRRDFGFGDFRRRRVVDDSSSGRRVTDEGSSWRQSHEDSTSRRRPIPFSEDGPPPRKKLFPSVHDEVADDEPPRRRSVFSALGKIQNDFTPSQSSNRHQQDEKDNRSHRPQSRSVFSRLSGPHPEVEDHPEDEEDDDEFIFKRQSGMPVIASRVQTVERPTLSREQVLASVKKDEKSKQRDRRMFGALVGTLQQFRKEETQVKEREERRQQIEKKLEDEALKDRKRMAEEKRNLLAERKNREADIKRIEWSLNRVKEFGEWEAGVLPLKDFIQTKSSPHVFYLPKRQNEDTDKLLRESAETVQRMIDKRRSMLEDEITNSELKAQRATRKLEDVDKENDSDNIGAESHEAHAHEEWLDRDNTETEVNVDKSADKSLQLENERVASEDEQHLDNVDDKLATADGAALNGNSVSESNSRVAEKKHFISELKPSSPLQNEHTTVSRKSKSQSRSKSHDSRRSSSPKPSKNTITRPSNDAEKRKKARSKSPKSSTSSKHKGRSKSTSKSKDSPKKLDINSRLEKLAGLSSSGPKKRSPVRRRRSSSSSPSPAKRSRSSSSSSSSSTSDD